MLLQHSRREARADAEGDLVLLEDQDRARWDHAMIDEGSRMLDRAMRSAPGAVPAAGGDRRPPRRRRRDPRTPTGRRSRRSTARSRAMPPSPVVELNRAVAVAMADGPDAGLPLMDALADELDGYHLFHPPAPICCGGWGADEAAAWTRARAGDEPGGRGSWNGASPGGDGS